MRTIRNSVFETNSSSCHVVTVLSDYEMEQLKNGEVLLLFSKRQNEKVITHIISEFRFEYELERHDFYYDDEGEVKYCNTDRKVMKALSKDLWKLLAEKYNIEDTEYRAIEDFMCSCCHEEQNEYCVSHAKEIELAGSKMLVASWEACC